MGSRMFGNRPDCAYYLLLGLCVAAMFTAFGGVFTYVGLFPQSVFQRHQHHSNEPAQTSGNYYEYGISEKSIEIYSIMGPTFLIIGVAIAVLVGVLAIKYDCEYEPEEPKIAILRLASEMSLNLSHGDSKYELMSRSTIPTASYSNPSETLHCNKEEGSSKSQVARSSASINTLSLPVV